MQTLNGVPNGEGSPRVLSPIPSRAIAETILTLLLLVLVPSIALSTAEAAPGKLAPDLRLETVQTPHFRIHYPRSHRRMTAYLSRYLEEAFTTLSMDLQWTPRRKIDVVVRSDTDVPNGTAQVFPINRLVIHAVPFQTQSFVGEYDNWLRTLVFHELTHIIANDSSSGLWRAMRAIFGSAAKTNPYQPLWLIEGLAVYYETLRGNYGRGRSNWVDMVLRTAALSDLLDPGTETRTPRRPYSPDDSTREKLFEISLDRLNDGPPSWPAGNTPYVYGYLVNEMMAKKAGEGTPGKISKAMSARVPFFVNSLAERDLGEDYGAIWARAVSELRDDARRVQAEVSTQPLSEVEKLTSTGRWTGSAAFRPGSPKIYAITDSYRNGLGLSVVDLQTQKETFLNRWRYGGGSRLQLIPGSEHLLYSRNEDFAEFREFSEVFVFDPESGDEVRVTEGARAMDPAPSPDAVWDPEKKTFTRGAIAYVKNLADGNQAIVLYDGKERYLFRGHRFERLSYPSWGRGSTEGWIFFSIKVNGGSERIQAIHAEDLRLRPVTPFTDPRERIADGMANVSADGTLLFSSSRGGIYNVYSISDADLKRAFDEETFPEPRRLTNVVTGAFFPQAADHPEQILATYYGPEGLDLALIRKGEFAGAPPLRESLRDRIRAEAREGSFAPEETVPGPEPKIDYPNPEEDYPLGTPKTYSIFPAIWPKYWVPDFRLVPDGFQGGLRTSGLDAVDRHRYDGVLAYDSRANFPVFDFTYQYDGFFPTLELSVLQENKYLGVQERSNRSDTFEGRAMIPANRSWYGLGGTWTESRYFEDRSKSAGIELRFYRSDFLPDPDAIDSEKGDRGYLIDLIGTNYFRTEEDRFSSIETKFEFRIPSPIDRQFIRLIASYGASNNDEISSLYFVGGGEANITERQPYLLRGYQSGSIFGRKIATVNTEYWFPLIDVFRGNGTLPVFLERSKMRLFFDAGSAEYVGEDRRRMDQWPISAGFHVLTDLRLFYRVPVQVGIGFDWGFRKELGGEKQVVLGLYSRSF